MNARRQQILNELEFGDYTAKELGVKLNAPAPSIRRAVAALREKGHAIRVNPPTGAYYLDSVEPVVDAYDTDIDSSDEDGDETDYDEDLSDDGGW